tara:strand:+ start:1042 stop:1422 length:381 start_codon:yes stop_codon:yes gene_type:complete
MRKNITVKKYKSQKKTMKGGGDCGCDKSVKEESFFSGGGNRRKRKYKNKSKKGKTNKKYKKKTKKYNTRKYKGGAFHGYDMLSLSGLDSQSMKITKNVLKGRPYKEGSPLEQPINYKYGSHHPPMV